MTPHPNHLAIISVVLLGVSLALILSERARGDFGGLRALTGLVAVGLLFAGIVASGSRAGLGAALVAAFLAVVATRDRSIVRVAIGFAAVGLVVVALLAVVGQDNAFERVGSASATAGSDEQRDEYNSAAWDRFTEEPITGVGFGEISEAHIFMLQFASGAGVLGIIAGLMIIFLAIRSYLVAVLRRVADDPPYWVAAGGFAAAVIAYLAAGIFQNILWDRNVWMAIVLMTWLATVPTRTSD